MAGIKDVDKVQRQLAGVQRQVKSMLGRVKNSEGDQKRRYLKQLQALKEKQQDLDDKLEAIIGSMHHDAEMEVDEGLIVESKNDWIANHGKTQIWLKQWHKKQANLVSRQKEGPIC